MKPHDRLHELSLNWEQKYHDWKAITFRCFYFGVFFPFKTRFFVCNLPALLNQIPGRARRQTMFHNWIPHLNAVTPRWPLRRSEPLISLALILLYWFLPPYKLSLSLLEPTVSFCTATIKITGQWNIPPEGRGGGFWNNFQPCPSF